MFINNLIKMRTTLRLSIFFIAFVAFSQNKTLDSLQLALKNSTNKSATLNAIADEYKSIDYKKTLDFATKALQEAKSNNDILQEANAYLNLGNSYIISGDYKKALHYFSSAKLLLEKEDYTSIEYKKSLAKAFGSIGIVFSEQSNYGKALQNYIQSVKIYQDLKDEVKLAKLYNNIGIIYSSQKNEKKALDYFFKAYRIQEKQGDKNIGITQTNIANAYLKNKNYTNALMYYNKAKLSLKNNPNVRALGEWYNNFGLYHKQNNNTKAAVENWNLAIETFTSIDDKFGIADTYLYLAQMYLDQSNVSLALENSNKVLKLSEELGVLEQQVLAQKLLSEAYKKQGNTSLALQHLQLYTIAKDKLINEENIRKSVEAEFNFELEKQELLQKKEQQQKKKWNTAKIVAAILFGLLVSGIVFLFYSKKQLKKRLTLEKELEEYKQKALHLQMNPHFIFNCLGSISSFIIQSGTEKAITYLAKFSKLMRLTLEYSKEALIPVDKEIESLQNYLELEQLRFNNKFDFEITKSPDIEDDMALPPLLLQPIVENAIIHGVAPSKNQGKITIDFSFHHNDLVCTVIDNGVGYNQSVLSKKNSVTVHKSMAIEITKKRLKSIEDKMNSKSKFEIIEQYSNNTVSGTKVTLSIPVQYYDLKQAI